ncbi:MAG: 2-oxo acid dehydrogenase subunit E2 [Chloroflexi bacterium]|nr:2-oxo acid dehydrogenase subunit E2 [Chloroflexota bacterium]
MSQAVIQLPQVGESVTEGIIGKWLKKPGDAVLKYEPLVEVVTDKVTMEVPSPYAGRITALLVVEGDTVPMGGAIAEMETAEPVAPSRQAREEATPESPVAQRPPAVPAIGRTGVLLKDVRPVGPTGSGEEPPIPAELASALQGASIAAASSVEKAHSLQRYSPVVRKLADERHVDLAKVRGTGLDGRVTKEDVLQYTEARRAPPAPAAPAPARLAGPAPAAFQPGQDEEAVPLTPLRRIIAENMVRSATQIPQAWSYVEADVTPLVARREGAKGEFLRREGVELTYLPFVIKALVECLKEHPMLNSAWGGDKIILKKRINVGIAVAAPQGLVVPVVHDADHLSIAGLAKACRDLTQRAREGALALADVHGGTITVNNTGALGSVLSQPLVNPPQAAIVTTEAIMKRPMVVPGDAIAVRSVMNLCISFDHRILDGAEAGAFMLALKRRVEAIGPETLLY